MEKSLCAGVGLGKKSISDRKYGEWEQGSLLPITLQLWHTVAAMVSQQCTLSSLDRDSHTLLSLIYFSLCNAKNMEFVCHSLLIKSWFLLLLIFLFLLKNHIHPLFPMSSLCNFIHLFFRIV